MSDRVRNIEAKLRKEYGAEAIPDISEIGVVSTGVPTVDRATGVDGLPRGRIIDIFGPEASGKTAIVLSTIAQVQEAGGIAAFIDAENALTDSFVKMLGANREDLLVAYPEEGEMAMTIVEDLVEDEAVDLVAIDSVAALVSKEELEGSLSSGAHSAQARMMAKALRRLAHKIRKTNTVVVFVNQLRSKPGVVFGPTEYSTGGRALRFYASVRIEIKKVEEYTANNMKVGHRVRVKVVKNRMAAPFNEAFYDLFFRSCTLNGVEYQPGIDHLGSLLDIAIEDGIIERNSSYYIFRDEQGEEILKVQGKKELRQVAAEHEIQILERLNGQIQS